MSQNGYGVRAVVRALRFAGLQLNRMCNIWPQFRRMVNEQLHTKRQHTSPDSSGVRHVGVPRRTDAWAERKDIVHHSKDSEVSNDDPCRTPMNILSQFIPRILKRQTPVREFQTLHTKTTPGGTARGGLTIKLIMKRVSRHVVHHK